MNGRSGSILGLDLGRETISSLVFDGCTFILLLLAHCSMLLNSSLIVPMLVEPTNRYVSSANLRSEASTTYDGASRVHLLISSLLLAALMLSLKICTSGCLPIGYRSIQTRRNLSGSALPSNFRSLTSPCSQKDVPPLPFTPVFETLA